MYSIHVCTVWMYVCMYVCMYVWLYSNSLGPWPLFQFLDLFTQSVGLLGRGISSSQGRYLHTEQHKHWINADIYTSRWIRNHNPSVWAGKDCSCLGHCDWHVYVCMYVCMYVWMYVRVYVRMYGGYEKCIQNMSRKAWKKMTWQT
jgi:hypothetical protein